MDAIIMQKNRVEKYFLAWKTYDIELLRTIFSDSAKYVIRGKRVLNGIEDIAQYWERNKERQSGLKLHWKTINSSFRREIINFGASFLDLETNLYTKVNGEIIFYYNKDNRIIKLSEKYKKRVNEPKNFKI